MLKLGILCLRVVKSNTITLISTKINKCKNLERSIYIQNPLKQIINFIE